MSVSDPMTCDRCGTTEGELQPSNVGVLCANCFAAQSQATEPICGLRTRGVLMERVRPIRWLWERRIPLGLPSLVVGEEGVGKGTTMAWLIARATRGELDGDYNGQPINVLVVGDEDGFESVWVPRIYTAGGDLQRLRTLDDGEYLDDLNARDADLAAAIERDGIGAIVLDQVLDHVHGGKDGAAVFNPKHVRQAMMPLRRVAGKYGIAAIGLLHPIKGRATSFRDLTAGSHQFNAVSRSSLLLGIDPQDRQRRILVRGKGNHSADPRSFEFRIGVRNFELNSHDFEMPLVEDATEGDRTIEDLISSDREAPVRDALAEQLAPLLTPEPQTLADLARAVDRDPKDQSVRRALKDLQDDKRAAKTDDGWVGLSSRGGVGVTPNGGDTGHHQARLLADTLQESTA
jgi:AAA domain